MKQLLHVGLFLVCLGLVLSNVAVAQSTGNVGIRIGVGTDIEGGLAYGSQLSYILNQGVNAFELGLAVFGGKYEETSNNGYNDYFEETKLLVFGALANYLIRYSLDVTSPYFVAGVGVGAVSVEWEERSDTDTSLGFTKIGAFRVVEMPGLVLTAFTNKNQAVCAVIYEHPIIGCFVDMFSENEEGLGLTVSNAPAGQALDQPPGREKIIDKTLTVQNIYDRLLKRRPPSPYKRVEASNFVEVFQTEYAEEMDWRMKRGGVTREEAGRIAQNMGITSEETVAQAAEVFRKQYTEEEHTLS